MFISNILKSFLRDTAIESENSFYLTDLKNVVGFADKNSYKEMKNTISRDLLSQLLTFANYNGNQQLYFFANNKFDVLPLMEKQTENKQWQSQIIFPIYLDDLLYGSLVMVNKNKTFKENEVASFMKVQVDFIFKMILDEIRKFERSQGLGWDYDE